MCEYCGKLGHNWTRHPEAMVEVNRRAWEAWDDHERHDESH